MEKEISDIKSQSLKLVWHMRGGISYTDVLNMSMPERQLITKIIQDNMETTKKSGLPFF
jgi:hypothetical protein